MNIGEAPVSVHGDNRGDKLGNAESEEQGDRCTLHEEESVGASDEDEGLGDDRNLEVNVHVQHMIVCGWDILPALERDTRRMWSP